MDIYYTDKGARVGPIDAESLQLLYRNRKIGEETLVWIQGTSDWLPLGNSELYELVKGITQEGPPPLKGDAINNTYVWALAFAPIIGAIIESFVAEALDKPIDNLWLITVALNIGISFYDEKKLEAAGVNTERFGSFAVLVPVYMFLRFRVLGQKPYYFIVWIMSFIVSASEFSN